MQSLHLTTDQGGQRCRPLSCRVTLQVGSPFPSVTLSSGSCLSRMHDAVLLSVMMAVTQPSIDFAEETDDDDEASPVLV